MIYTPVLAKYSKNFSLEDSLAIGVDRMQRNFGPLKQQVEEWQEMELSTASAKLCHWARASSPANRYDSSAMSSANPIRHISDTALWVGSTVHRRASAQKLPSRTLCAQVSWGSRHANRRCHAIRPAGILGLTSPARGDHLISSFSERAERTM